jgi:hypothetical protein
MGLTTHPHLETRLKKGHSYISTHPLLCFHSTLEDEVYFTSLLALLAYWLNPENPAKLDTRSILRPWVYTLKN